MIVMIASRRVSSCYFVLIMFSGGARCRRVRSLQYNSAASNPSAELSCGTKSGFVYQMRCVDQDLRQSATMSMCWAPSCWSVLRLMATI
ncbi:hypothetical protein F5Y19DRAFT_413823 [Xylariaceae sp. FL1651]|nr:hypothetical protein F5Y19DRAFT_413823 [Xylariaceae sp. FL1651]